MTTFKAIASKSEGLRQSCRYGDSYGEDAFEFSEPVTKQEATDLLDVHYHGGIKHPMFPYSYVVRLVDSDFKASVSSKSTYVMVDVTQTFLD